MNHAGPARSASRSRSAHPGPVVAAGIAQVADDLGELGLHVGVPGRVGETDGRPFGINDPRPAPPA